MNKRKTVAIAAGMLSLAIFLVLFASLQQPTPGKLELYEGRVSGIEFKGVTTNKNGETSVLFRYRNPRSYAVALKPRTLLRQNETGNGWREEKLMDTRVFRVPGKHAITFQFLPPAGDDPWRVKFEEARVPHASLSLMNKVKQTLGMRSRFPPFDGVFATP